MDFITPMIAKFFADPALQGILWGFAVKLGVDRIKGLFAKVDADGVPEGFKLPLQQVVIAMSGLTAMLQLALQGNLSSFDPNLIMNFVALLVTTYAGSLAAHKVSNMVVTEVKHVHDATCGHEDK